MAKLFYSLSDPELISMIQDGAIGVMPTDTVYGLVGRAELPDTITRMYGIKQRERQPGTTIAASVEQLRNLGFPSDSLDVAGRYWPDALSVEMSAANIAPYLRVGQGVMAARVPQPQSLVNLLAQTGPLMTTSANASKQPTSATITKAQEYFGDSVDFYVDAGDLGDRPPSTIIGINPDHSLVVYREGAAKIQ